MDKDALGEIATDLKTGAEMEKEIVAGLPPVDYEAIEKRLEEERAKGLDDAERSDANEDSEFGPPWIDGELPAFWKPEMYGERRVGEVTAVRKTKDFGKGVGEAINLRGGAGLFAIPVSAGLADIDWRRHVGRVFLFIFKGWFEFELPDGTMAKMRKFIVRPKKGDGVPF
ncbi:MAG: hypothetical protein IMZ50_14865 [Candidatus Atribacteria bacterium]|nr:hypothetical protein [Candidatus Atribacteria bacterium]